MAGFLIICSLQEIVSVPQDGAELTALCNNSSEGDCVNDPISQVHTCSRTDGAHQVEVSG